MAKFAIVRGDGSVDRAEAISLADAYASYGAPGNGEIVEWSDEKFGTPRYDFASADEQMVQLAADAENQS